ncbi:MAG: sulfatase-like hydrolase/transferase [Bacteroidetes bacterium]|nr:sulfatase-like hydrolase/transferase [Bacteroidota bacterium]
MRKIYFIQKLAFALLLLLAAGAPGFSADKTNVILILIDDMGYMDSETYGSEYYNTPNLTRLANEGMLFTNGYAASPLCSPTRASIMAGQHPARIRMTQAITNKDVAEPQATQPQASWNCGDVQNRHHLPLDIYTLGEALQDSAYHTAHIGKWHLYHSSLGEEYWAGSRGFDFVIGGNHAPGPPDYYSPYKNSIPNLDPGPEGEYLNERLAEEAIDWISTVKDSENPFFLNFWHYAVHGPVIPKLDLLQKYIDSRDPDADQRCPEMATMLESMDTSIGMLLDWLDEPENAELKANTVIILTSDNGGNIHNTTPNGDFWTSNRPLRGGKANTYEGGTRVPWIIRWNDTIPAGSVCHTAVQSTDIYPTILDITGIPPKTGHTLDGRSILPLFKGEAMEEVPIFTDFPHRFGALCAPSTTVRFGDWKLLRYYWAGERAESHYYELFNLELDPKESINLRDYYPEKVAELDALISQHLADVDALIPIANPNYTGPSPFTRSDNAPAVTLAQDILYYKESGRDTIQLIDDKGAPHTSSGLLIEGENWVSVENTEDGKVIISWDTIKKDGPARVLIAWSGGASVRETNGWTRDPLELELQFKDWEDLSLKALGSGNVSPIEGIHSYPLGELVELTATPAGEADFVNWIINGEAHTLNPLMVTMDTSLNVYALFSDGNIARFAHASARAYNKEAYPSKANDGDITAWSGWVDRVDAAGMPSWLEFTWTHPRKFNRVVVYANPNQGYNINDYTLQFWNGSVYRPIIQIENNTDAVRTSTFPAVSADRLRLYCTDEGDQAKFYRIDETEVYYDTREIVMEDPVGNGTVTPDVGIHTLASYDTIQLHAVPGEEWTFSKWIIDAGDFSENPLNVYVNDISSVRAYFNELPDLTALQDAIKEDLPGINIYPNPASNILYISSNSAVRYMISDIQGKLLLTGTAKDHSIDIASLIDGLYLIQIDTDGQTETKRFVK